MKITLDMCVRLVCEARKLAARERTTFQALVEEGLRRVIAGRRHHRPFRLRKASFKGRGLQPELRDASWARVRDTAYES